MWGHPPDVPSFRRPSAPRSMMVGSINNTISEMSHQTTMPRIRQPYSRPMSSSLPTRDKYQPTRDTTNLSIISNATTTAEIGRPCNILCLVKGRGKAGTETGLACMDLRRNTITLCQFCDDQLYTQLLTALNRMDPTEIVVSQTLRDSPALEAMFDKLQRACPRMKVQCIPRRYMNDIRGREYVKRLCSKDSSGVDVALQSKVYALLAVAGLLTYTEESRSMYLAPHTIKMMYHSGENSMVIERGLIESRLDAVQELVQNSEVYGCIRGALEHFPDLEYLISICVQMPRQESRATAESKIKHLLCLKSALDNVPMIRQSLEEVQSSLLKDYCKALNMEGLSRIQDIILAKLSETASVTSGLLSMKGQKVFAVRTGLDGKLDAMRSVYNQLVDRTEEEVRHLSETYQLALRLTFSSVRGFHISVKLPKNSEPPEIPAKFLKVTKSRGNITMTTDKLILLNARINECLDAIYSLSNRIVDPINKVCKKEAMTLNPAFTTMRIVTAVLSDVHEEISSLNSLVTAIGNLDMIMAFAQISRLPEYVKPVIGDMLALRAARHPVIEKHGIADIVPNDVCLSENNNLMIITGANNSGKSFYLRTVGVIQVLAQIGCFVPADFAMIRICDRLFSRIGSDNNAGHLESSFTVEMKEMSYILKHQSPSSLIILDELCRGTSVTEGVEICFSICEKLVKTEAFTLFATHFKDICQLEQQHVNCTNFCFVTKYEISGSEGKEKITNDHKLARGIAAGSRYGLKLAATMNFPDKLIEDAFAIAGKLDGLDITQNWSLDSSSLNSSKNLLARLENSIYSEVKAIAMHGGSDHRRIHAIRQVAGRYHREMQDLKEMGEIEKSSDRNVESFDYGDVSTESNNHILLTPPQNSPPLLNDSDQLSKYGLPSFMRELGRVSPESTSKSRTPVRTPNNSTTGSRLVNYSISPISTCDFNTEEHPRPVRQKPFTSSRKDPMSPSISNRTNQVKSDSSNTECSFRCTQPKLGSQRSIPSGREINQDINDLQHLSGRRYNINCGMDSDEANDNTLSIADERSSELDNGLDPVLRSLLEQASRSRSSANSLKHSCDQLLFDFSIQERTLPYSTLGRPTNDHRSRMKSNLTPNDPVSSISHESSTDSVNVIGRQTNARCSQPPELSNTPAFKKVRPVDCSSNPPKKTRQRVIYMVPSVSGFSHQIPRTSNRTSDYAASQSIGATSISNCGIGSVGEQRAAEEVNVDKASTITKVKVDLTLAEVQSQNQSSIVSMTESTTPAPSDPLLNKTNRCMETPPSSNQEMNRPNHQNVPKAGDNGSVNSFTEHPTHLHTPARTRSFSRQSHPDMIEMLLSQEPVKRELPSTPRNDSGRSIVSTTGSPAIKYIGDSQHPTETPQPMSSTVAMLNSKGSFLHLSNIIKPCSNNQQQHPSDNALIEETSTSTPCFSDIKVEPL